MSAHLFKPYELRATEVSGSPDVEALYTQILRLWIAAQEIARNLLEIILFMEIP